MTVRTTGAFRSNQDGRGSQQCFSKYCVPSTGSENLLTTAPAQGGSSIPTGGPTPISQYCVPKGRAASPRSPDGLREGLHGGDLRACSDCSRHALGALADRPTPAPVEQSWRDPSRAMIVTWSYPASVDRVRCRHGPPKTSTTCACLAAHRSADRSLAHPSSTHLVTVEQYGTSLPAGLHSSREACLRPPEGHCKRLPLDGGYGQGGGSGNVIPVRRVPGVARTLSFSPTEALPGPWTRCVASTAG